MHSPLIFSRHHTARVIHIKRKGKEGTCNGMRVPCSRRAGDSGFIQTPTILAVPYHSPVDISRLHPFEIAAMYIGCEIHFGEGQTEKTAGVALVTRGHTQRLIIAHFGRGETAVSGYFRSSWVLRLERPAVALFATRRNGVMFSGFPCRNLLGAKPIWVNPASAGTLQSHR